jgi:mono/diheme cytochrome c family protein
MHSRNVMLPFVGALAFGLLVGAHVAAQDAGSDAVVRGQYLVRAGDCASCHTDSNGKPFAGGRAIPTPFGTIYSTNITPDKETGIDQWTEQNFYDALHNGVDDEGSHLYPAMPYPWYTKLSRADVDAIRAYLATVAPVNQVAKSPQLPWPLSWRGAMVGWNLLYFDAGEYKPDATQSPQWNRGAYLVEGLAHCGACHTPKNVLGGTKHGQPYEGGDAGLHWFAPGLGDDLRDGVGGWSNAEIVEYLKTGANAKSASAGPMSEVVMNSTQYLSDADLQAVAVYLKKRPTASSKSSPTTAALGAAALTRGQALYIDNCTACHMPDGRGVADVFPPLTGSSAVQADNAGTVVHVVLEGARMAAPSSRPSGLAMPGFGWKLDDHQIADVVNYIRHAWGNRAPLVDAATVGAVRKDIEPSDSPSRDAVTLHPDAPLQRKNR